MPTFHIKAKEKHIVEFEATITAESKEEALKKYEDDDFDELLVEQKILSIERIKLEINECKRDVYVSDTNTL